MINLDAKLPLISCLMVTANGRFETFRRACQCYFDQTYPNRELVVVNEGTLEYQQQMAAHLSDRNNVQFIFLNGSYTLGALRNIAVRLCRGDLFCQWDDDDFNAPERLTVQFRHLASNPKARVSYFSDQLHFYFPTRELYWESWAAFQNTGLKKYSLIPGTIMAYKEGFDYRYPSSGQHCRAGEDSVLAYDLINRKESSVVLFSDCGYLMVYSYHGKNVWDLHHHQLLSRDRSFAISRLLQQRERISETIEYLKLDGPIRVMGRDGLAFVYGGEI